MPGRLQRFLPPRLRVFFGGGETLTWESPLSPEVVKERLGKALLTYGLSSWETTGFYGVVRGDEVLIVWRRAMTANGFAHAFHGTVGLPHEPGAIGAVTIIQGTFAGSRLARILIAIWMSPVVLVGLVMIWTVIVPLAAWGMLWALNGMMCLADGFFPHQQTRIRSFLTRACDPAIPAEAIADVPL